MGALIRVLARLIFKHGVSKGQKLASRLGFTKGQIKKALPHANRKAAKQVDIMAAKDFHGQTPPPGWGVERAATKHVAGIPVKGTPRWKQFLEADKRVPMRRTGTGLIDDIPF